ncbi:PREDICTED: uncharacterized protein LOC108380181 [Rhagoletis zephyria]|uniref:uncharacterized protein LOC108380181 n=1 Tax=Rhagoletis zephyria TaxID=28612 RepID=UPI0008114CA3|nr:PREDICTED: uncharacterized protein LOC108380181 [Rhagoletis zephyria]
MAKLLHLTVVLLLLTVAIIQGNACLIQIRLTKPGQRICELRCRQSGEIPPLNCYTATRVYRAVVCPRHCCRLEGNRCRRL